ncbi:glycoside hydrolase family protein [Kaistella carnis]|uniref:glycoside hydrolase family protein n=2 Tax=Kaistella carnis TaxID=1241979 RepID=UPI0028A66F49|nr:glycoside hydrolase family protein [Kaistella carnis]
MATIIRPNQEFTTKATVSKGDTQLVSWIIFNGHNSDAANILQIQPKIGLELDYSFSQEGKYRIAAYQKEIQTKDDYQSSTELKHVDLTVSYNLLDGSKLIPKNPENFLAGDSLRKGFPAVFEAKFLIKPPTADELSRLQFRLEDAAGNKINEGSAVANVFTFTPRNSNAKYKLTAEYTNEAGVVSKQTFSGTSKALSIKDITHGAQIVRPGTAMSFNVTKTQFQFPIGNGTNLPESGEIKWNLDKVLIGTGKTITIPGNLLLQQKKYHIEAYVTSAIGKTKGDNKDSAHNDWHFEVKENIVEKIKIIKKPKAGLIGDFEIEEMTFKDYDAAKDGAISWRLTGPETGGGSGKTFSKLFKIAGEYTLSCTLGGRECREPLKISIVAPIINVDKCKWIDKDNGSGNIITEAGKDQEVCVFVNGDGLDNENLTLNVYDDDALSKRLVYTFTFDSNDAHKTGFYHPFTITEDVIKKIKESGTADYGDLYFNIVRNNVDLQIRNGDQKLGEFLKVTLDPKIINAYFCDANDTQQVLISALNGALYFKIYAINMVDKKVEINFLTESDAYWSWKDELELDDYEDIKKKFSDERIIDTTSATFNNKGEILVPVNLSKIGKPKNFIRLNAIVKIIAEKKEEAAQKKELGFYMIHKDLTLLYPPATLPTIAENKGAVMVGREKISGGGDNCGGKFCITKDSPNSKLIREVNIRLAGFGGSVPTDEFSNNTENMIKQFQRDYMRVAETGKICGNVLKAIDEFCDKYIEQINDYKCPCQNPNNSKETEKASIASRCSEGWGKGLYSDQYLKSSIAEPYRKYEYPGMHRSILWAVSAMKFYLEFSKSVYSKYDVNRGYRCWADNNFHSRKSTNHFGKAADIRFNKNGERAKLASDANKIRTDIFNKYLNAKWWGNPNFFTLEKESDGAVTYVHVDCRDFEVKYLENKYFVKTQNSVMGKSIVQLANDLGFKDTCACIGSFASNDSTKNNSTERVDPKTLKASEKLVIFMKDWEKYKKMPYNDSKFYCTVGYGHLIKKMKCENITIPSEFQNGLTEAEASELFKKDIKVFELAVQRDVTVKLYQREFDALVDLLYNTGAYFLSTNKAPKLYKNLLDEKYEEAAKEFLDIENTTRRKQNYEMFINGNYDSKH